MQTQFKTIDEYIKTFPEDIQKILQNLRKTIREEAPDAVETISYQMPTFKLKGKNLIHFAAFKSHIGVYPTASKLEPIIEEVTRYRTGKGTLQFPLAQPIPLDLIKRIVSIRVNEILAK